MEQSGRKAQRSRCKRRWGSTLEPIVTLVADPPWKYGDALPGNGRGASKHYRTLEVWEIQRIDLPPLAKDCRLFLWTTGNFLRPAFSVMEAWGFRDSGAQMIWHKLGRLGMGRTVRVQHEYVLIGVRGRPPVLNHSTRSVFEARPGIHSAKPDEFYDLAESLSPGPYADLFARRERPGWYCWGDELSMESKETDPAALDGHIDLESLKMEDSSVGG